MAHILDHGPDINLALASQPLQHLGHRRRFFAGGNLAAEVNTIRAPFPIEFGTGQSQRHRYEFHASFHCKQKNGACGLLILRVLTSFCS